MLTPDDLRNMTPEERTALFGRLCAAWYGDRLTDPTVAADFEVRRETVSRWRREHSTPAAVLFTLERWINSEARAEKIIADWGTIPAQLADVTAGLSRVASTLNRIANLTAGPAASGEVSGA